MPLYSYVCKECGKKFDLLVGMTSENEESRCEKCGSRNIERILAPFGIRGSSGSKSSSACATCTTGKCNTCSVG